MRAPPLPPRYRAPRLVGRGGMAEIYRARDAELGRDVAVKVLADAAADDEDLRARFLREGLAAARLSGQPHTVSIFDVGELDGRPFIVMEYLGGGSLADRLRAATPPRGQALRWLEQAARALDSAHALGVVHRDVKPGNLLLDERGDVHVADFGIARADGLASHTQTGVVLGTAGYLAPEQLRGEPATAASDRYALAVVAHELLTGARPGEASPDALPPAAAAVVARALATDPNERFGSCLDFVAALRSSLASPSLAAEAPTVAIRRRRSRAPALVALLGALGILGAVLAWGLSPHRAKPAPTPTVVRRVTVTTAGQSQPVASVTPTATPVAASHGHGRKRGHEKHPKGHGHGRS